MTAGTACRSDRQCLISGTKGYLTVDNVNNPQKITVYLESENFEIAHNMAVPAQLTGYEYQVRSCMKALEEGNIVIVASFQGITDEGDITTLGRGGSDTTAVAVAAGLKADICEIYTDVDGVYTADPRVVPNALKLKEITFGEMLELARLGAGVMQPRAVEYGELTGTDIHVRSTFNRVEGTIIRGEYTMLEEKKFNHFLFQTLCFG